jgi:hypothetical protein
MHTVKAVILSCFVTLTFAALGSAQGGPGGAMGPMMGRIPQPRGIFNPIVGSGAQYEVQSGDKEKRMIEIDVVGKESVNGKEGYWLETTMSGTPMGDVVVKMLTVANGSSGMIQKMIMQMPGHPPMEMPEQMGRMAQQDQEFDIRAKADKVGTDSVTTPAGTFTADHYRMKDGTGDFWVSDKVSPYGVVKGQGKDLNLVLTKTLTDVKDKITGTPVPFNPQMMMQGRGRPQQ